MWTPLHCHSHYSLLDGLSQPKHIAERCASLGYNACAITDHGTISGAVSFSEALQKKNIKPILGNEFYLSKQDASIKNKDNRKLSHLVILSKNLKGWHQLIQATSKANSNDLYYYKPRLNLDMLADYCDGNLLSFSGHPGSDLANVLTEDISAFYNSKTEEEAKKHLKPDARQQAVDLAYKYQDIFGKGNFFIEIQLIDKVRMPSQQVIVDILREVSVITGIPCVATADSHYTVKEQAEDQRVILCSSLNTTFKNVYDAIGKDEEVGLRGFFESEQYHIPSLEEIRQIGHTDDEIATSNLISSMCEEYSVLSKPRLPNYKWTEGLSEIDYLRKLCREGWVKKSNYQWDNQVYGDRVKKELDILENAKLGDGDLSSYFLIVQDYVNEAKNRGWLVGTARGSAGGSLVAYLSGITELDPIPNDLIFERFYNAGRNTADRVSLPDIDVDFPVSKRKDIIEYIRDRYGHDKVCQMVTFGRLQGRGALKEVLRVHSACDHYTANRMTKHIYQEHEIADQLDSAGHKSILRWMLENEPKTLKDYCVMKDDGTLTGQYSRYFEQAIRLEGTFRNQGKHAAGLIIAAEPLADVCPMLHDKKGDELIAGMDMNDMEKMGHVKFDILGVLALDKLMGVNDLLRYGKIQ